MEEGIKELDVMGIKVSLDMDCLDDVEVMDMLADLNDGNVFVINRLLRKLFASDYQRIKDSLSEGGRFRASTASDFLLAVLQEAGAKN